MAQTPSTMVQLGTQAQPFILPDTASDMAQTSLDDVRGEVGTVVMFICNHCPFVKHVNDELVRVANDYIDDGIGFVAISANDAERFPQDGPEEMARVAREQAYPFPYLYDETQEVARAYRAACTPDFFVFDADDTLVYRGQLDDSRPGNAEPVTGKSLRAALDALVAGDGPIDEQTPSVGCGIKWKD